MPKTPHEVLEFWFSDQMRPYWFAKSDDIDRDIAARFSDTYEAAHAGHLDDWMDAPDSALALVIALDQFPRNIYRGGPRSFESNDLSLRHARTVLSTTTPSCRRFPARRWRARWCVFAGREILSVLWACPAANCCPIT